MAIVNEAAQAYAKGISIDAKRWEPLREAHPEWLEPIELYGTEEGWDQLKTLVDNQPDAVARHQQWVERIAPAARQIHAFTDDDKWGNASGSLTARIQSNHAFADFCGAQYTRRQ